jgi:hypothetical protein
MDNAVQDKPGKSAVTVVRWTKKPGQDPAARFVLLSVVGLVLGLILMTFLPVLRSFGAVTSFTVLFAALFTAPAVSGRRRLLQGLAKRVNDTIGEVTGTPGDQLSVKQFRQLINSGERLALPVSGVPGLCLQVERAPALEKNAPEKWSAILTVIPPENGTASFDRLVAAAVAEGSSPG